MSAQAMLSELKALRDIISTSIDAIVNDCERDKVDFPSHDEPFNPSSVDIRQKAVVSEAITKIVAASQQLIVSVQAPQQTLSVFNLGVCIHYRARDPTDRFPLQFLSLSFRPVLVLRRRETSLNSSEKQDPR